MRSIKLDASPLGQPLYEQLGFRAEFDLSCWVSESPPNPALFSPAIREAREADLDQIAAIDAQIFGVERAELLRLLFRQSTIKLVVEAEAGKLTAFGFTRQGSRANHIGPVAALHPESGAALFHALLARAQGRSFAWIPDANNAAVATVKQLGLTAQRHLTRMFLQENISGDAKLQFTIAAPDLG